MGVLARHIGLAVLAAVALVSPSLSGSTAAAKAVPSASAHTVRHTYAPGAGLRCDRVAYKPKAIMVACADGNLYLTKIHYRSYTAHRAVGHGRVHYNDCKPYCARGHFHTMKAKVTLSRPRHCRAVDARVFTRVHYLLAHRPIGGFSRKGTARYPCSILHARTGANHGHC